MTVSRETSAEKPEPVWTDEEKARVAHWATMAADHAHFDLLYSGKPFTGSEDSAAMVREAIDMLIGVGLVKPVPSSEWPENIALSPPYVPDPWAMFRKTETPKETP